MFGTFDQPRGRKRVTKDGIAVTSLTTGVAVSARDAMACMENLLHDLHALWHDGEAMLVDLQRACQGRRVEISDPYSKVRFRLYLGPDGSPRELVKDVVAAAVRWDGDHIVLLSPFAEGAMREAYAQKRRELAASKVIPAQALATDVDRRHDESGKDLDDARQRDEASGRTTVLTSGARVPVETAKEVMYSLTLPMDAAGRLDEEIIVSDWKFCRGDPVPAGLLSEFKQAGLADAEGMPDPIFKAVVTAAVRWDVSGNLVLTSPFAEEAVQAEYATRCREGRFEPALPAKPGWQLLTSPPGHKSKGRPHDERGGRFR